MVSRRLMEYFGESDEGFGGVFIDGFEGVFVALWSIKFFDRFGEFEGSAGD
jgi:hypothetical protein